MCRHKTQQFSSKSARFLVKFLLLSLLPYSLTQKIEEKSDHTDDFERELPPVDSNGYVFFCLCMGRFGNQAEHLLGGIAFAEALNRTLILPPWRTYKNVEFDEWFLPGPIQSRRKAILAKDFMRFLAPKVWPPERRIGFCYQLGGDLCQIKVGNPFTNFWDELGVDFVDMVRHQVSYVQPEVWKSEYPPDKYPVVALKGAPASFPMHPAHLLIQKELDFSEGVRLEAEGLLEKHFGTPNYDYVGIHLRNGIDWSNACQHVEEDNNKRIPSKLMSSYQCVGWDYHKPLTLHMCFPTKDIVLATVKKVLEETGLRKVLVATDKDPMVKELRVELGEGVIVAHPDPWLPVVDTYLLSHSKVFIGNCVSSFSAFVWRQRETHDLGPSYHFGNYD